MAESGRVSRADPAARSPQPTGIRDAVAAELCRARVVPGPGPRRAELAAALQVAAAMRITGRRVVIAADLDSGPAAAWLARRLRGCGAEPRDITISVSAPAGPLARRAERDQHRVRLERGATELARRIGLLDRRGRVISGLPARVVAAGPRVAAAIWRGAVLSAGRWPARAGRVPVLEVPCPSEPVALALAGAARHLHLRAAIRSAAGAATVLIRGTEQISTLLGSIDAPHAARSAAQPPLSPEPQEPPQPTPQRARPPGFATANHTRSQAAAAQVAAHAELALQIGGADLPDRLREAGRLRVDHPHASLDQLGRLADPPLSKDAIAGRLRRLLRIADRAAPGPRTLDTTRPDPP